MIRFVVCARARRRLLESAENHNVIGVIRLPLLDAWHIFDIPSLEPLLALFLSPEQRLRGKDSRLLERILHLFEPRVDLNCTTFKIRVFVVG
jgi:hypothetical protein